MDAAALQGGRPLPHPATDCAPQDTASATPPVRDIRSAQPVRRTATLIDLTNEVDAEIQRNIEDEIAADRPPLLLSTNRLGEVIDLTDPDVFPMSPVDAASPPPRGGGAQRRTPPRNRSPYRTPEQNPKAPKNGFRLSRFVFTLNNYTEQEYTDLTTRTAPTVKWMIIGKEVSETGTPHLQGACIIGTRKAFSTVKTFPGLRRAHIEKMNGSPHDSLTYCSKQDAEPFQYGTLPEPGKRNDLHEAVEAIKSGATMTELAEGDHAVQVVKFHKGLTTLRSLLAPSEREPPTIIWLHGPTGSGKTRSAIEFAERMAGPGQYWISAGSLRWFDGYDSHEFAIFDDFRAKHATFSFLLRLLDRYELRVEFKGGFIRWAPRYIIVTANVGPREMWSFRTEEQLDQLERRITETRLVTEYPIEPKLACGLGGERTASLV